LVLVRLCLKRCRRLFQSFSFSQIDLALCDQGCRRDEEQYPDGEQRGMDVHEQRRSWSGYLPVASANADPSQSGERDSQSRDCTTALLVLHNRPSGDPTPARTGWTTAKV
jgi:hypothetical protein